MYIHVCSNVHNIYLQYTKHVLIKSGIIVDQELFLRLYLAWSQQRYNVYVIFGVQLVVYDDIHK